MPESEILAQANEFIGSQGCKGVSVMNFLWHGGIRMTRKLGLASLRRIMHYEDYSASVRMQATDGEEWYWYNLVVRPEAQGKHLVGKPNPRGA